MRILIVNPFGIGDVLFTTPLLRNLKKNFPDASLWFICNKRVYPFLRSNPFCDRVIIFEKDEWRDLGKRSGIALARELFSLFKVIRNERFDMAFDLSLNLQYGFFLALCAIRTRIGFDYRGRGRFLTVKHALPCGYKDRHVARQILDLLPGIGVSPKDFPLDIFVDQKWVEPAREIFAKEKISHTRPLIAVCPGSGDSWGETAYFKRWPKEYFVALCDMLSRQLKARVILFGSAGEASLAGFVENRAETDIINLCGKMTLTDFVGALKLCDLLITNDGGPFHIGQSLGLKTIGLFGPVDEKVYGAYPEKQETVVLTSQVDCRPCYRSFKFNGCTYDKKCLRQILPEQVMDKVRAVLNR